MISQSSYRLPLAFALAVLLALVTACAGAGETTGPGEPAGTARLEAATVTQGTGVFTFDRVHFWACVGESVHNVVRMPFQWTQVVTPTGDVLYRELSPNAEGVGTVTGLTSGHIWRRDVKASPLIQHTMGGGMTHFTYQGRFVSETGPALFVHEVFHVSRDASGEITVRHHEVSCRVMPD